MFSELRGVFCQLGEPWFASSRDGGLRFRLVERAIGSLRLQAEAVEQRGRARNLDSVLIVVGATEPAATLSNPARTRMTPSAIPWPSPAPTWSSG